METCALARAAASFRPSPTISGLWPEAMIASMARAFWGGLHAGGPASIPAPSAARSTAEATSPERMRTFSPRAFNAATVSAASGRRRSAKRKRMGASSPTANHSSVSRALVDGAPTKAARPRRAVRPPITASTPSPTISCAPTATGPGPAAAARPRLSTWREARARGAALATSSGLAPIRLGRAFGEHAGLVEHHGVDLGQALQRRAGLHQHAPAEQATRGGDLHGRHRQAQGAGAGDDQAPPPRAAGRCARPAPPTSHQPRNVRPPECGWWRSARRT